MRYLRIYEDFRDIKAGDIVVSTDTLPKNKNNHELIAGKEYKVIFIGNGYAEVEELDGNYQGYFLLARFLPKIEYDQNKFNL